LREGKNVQMIDKQEISGSIYNW